MEFYIVEQGDTISKVSNRFGVRPSDLLLENEHLFSLSDYIYPGEKLNIPKRKYTFKERHRYDCVEEYGPIDIEEDVVYLKKHFQSLVSIQRIGRSVMGKPIYAFTIGHGKKEVFYSGGWHANEWMTSKFLMLFLKEKLQNFRSNGKFFHYDLVKLFQDIKLIIVPMVNPDGIELVQQGIYLDHPNYQSVLDINKGVRRFEHWSSNIRGVDLNHQWPAGWKIEAEESPQLPWPRHYSGKAPLTEPETQAIYQLTKRHDFAYVHSFHSQGQVIYWGYKNLEPKESEAMVKKLSIVSSYEPIQTADSDGGYKDWFIQETKKPGFTIEIGIGTNPLPFAAFAEIWSNNVLLALEGLTL